MPLSPNSRLGPYEIKSALGVGGMGEVYRAHDSRLNRDVAIKILREDAAEDPERRARFEREAHAIAALNHPNVVAVYDFGIEDGQQYIVSELVEGDSLRSLLTGKRVPLRKLVDIGTQVANGLAAAHAAGFVHRDLKPENIMLTAEGRVKILDFGLAHRQKPHIGINDTITGAESTMSFVPPSSDAASLTHAGAVVGTASYMSPEQALGKEIDFHSDQFSFGSSSMSSPPASTLSSRASAVETMAAIVREDPAPLDESVPTPLRWIIDRCLAKEPSQPIRLDPRSLSGPAQSSRPPHPVVLEHSRPRRRSGQAKSLEVSLDLRRSVRCSRQRSRTRSSPPGKTLAITATRLWPPMVMARSGRPTGRPSPIPRRLTAYGSYSSAISPRPRLSNSPMELRMSAPWAGRPTAPI